MSRESIRPIVQFTALTYTRVAKGELVRERNRKGDNSRFKARLYQTIPTFEAK